MSEQDEVKVEVVIDEVDVNRLVDVEKGLKAAGDQLDKVSGTILRLTREQDAYYEQERVFATQLDQRRKELIERYKLDDKRQWKIDLKTRKVIYFS